MIPRRDILKSLAGGTAAALWPFATAPASAQLAGAARVSADVRPVQGDLTGKVLLGDGHALLALALILDDPVAPVCAWQGDFARYSNVLFRQYADRFPAIADIPVVGEASPASFSIEAALASEPEVAILAGSYGPGPEDTHILARLEAAGTRIVFVDFYENPLENTAPSIRALGQLFGGQAQARAEAFAAFHEARIAEIRERLAQASPERPTVLLQAHTGADGWPCCYMPGGGGLGEFIALAGGDNIGTDLAATRPWVQSGLEYVLSRDPDIFLTTGGPYLAGRGGPVLGPGVSEADARASLADSVSRAEINALTAVREKRVHAMWHLVQATPFNAIGAQALARWLHPDLFDDIDPAQTIAALNRDFLAVPLDGTFTLSL